ncbi:MAG TPA: hypothetical protein PKL08_09060 [Thermoanaerobaculaceae bacterium]|nr:hypothetical protein [Thermoanaerobaculaceae bacterium]
MGLFAPPATEVALVRLTVPHEDAELVVHLDPRFFAPPYLKKNRLLFAIEGYGRFWLTVEGNAEGSGGLT